jgi:hypothetical protein
VGCQELEPNLRLAAELDVPVGCNFTSLRASLSLMSGTMSKITYMSNTSSITNITMGCKGCCQLLQTLTGVGNMFDSGIKLGINQLFYGTNTLQHSPVVILLVLEPAWASKVNT